MKRNFAIALLALSTLATGGKAVAQEPAVKATVPFEFTVGGRLMPAATYTITSSSGVLVIQSADRHFVAITTAGYDDRTITGGGKLVFNKYGDQYFLHEVLCPAASMHAWIAPSKLEKRVQIQEAKLSGAEPVLVAAR
jgi:hypothetical protein